jgi:bifunctional non-homologous end joining protein LigD
VLELFRRRDVFRHPTLIEKATPWLIPKLVGEVKFTEWTSEGEMRHPAFLGLRSDKKVFEVIREEP